jgi:hypothetical protein
VSATISFRVDEISLDPLVLAFTLGGRSLPG